VSVVKVELCPETGICSLLKADSGKVDLMPGEVAELRQAGADPQKVRLILAEVGSSFAADLSDDELLNIISRL
jgi:hypothetical protein